MAYSDVVIADNPSWYWRFEEASGAYLPTFGSNTATVIGNPTRVLDNAVGGGIRSVGFPSVNDYVQLGSAGTIPSSANRSSFSWECWFKVSTIPDEVSGQGAYQLIGTDSQQAGFSNRAWSTEIGRRSPSGSVGCLFVTVASGGSLYVASSSVRFDNNQWHHVVGTHGGGNIRFYVDGVLQASASSSGLVNSSSNAPVIGYIYGFGGSYPHLAFPGLIDEVAIYHTVLSEAQILAHYNAGIASVAVQDWYEGWGILIIETPTILYPALDLYPSTILQPMEG